MKILLVTIFFAFSCFLLNCSNIAGTASEVDGKYAVKGIVVDNTGKPATNALVRIRPTGYLALYGNPSVALNTLTDDNGLFFFDTIPVDSYTIEILHNNRTGALQQLTICSFDSFPIMLPTITITPTGAIKGRINLPMTDDTSRPWIALYSVEYMIQSPYTQEFTFSGIPKGIYSLRILPFWGSKLEINLHDISVTEKCTTDVGTLNFTIQQFFKGCTRFECDSTAVQEILDANGLNNISMHSVIVRNPVNGRILELNLSNKMVTTITKNIGSLSQLRILNLRNNTISSIPEQIGYLQELTALYLDSNNLYDLPEELGYLDSLDILSLSHNNLYRIADQIQYLHITNLDLCYNQLISFPDQSNAFPDLTSLNIDNNKITTIPKSLMKREFQFLSVKYNQICSLSVALSNWLDSFDKNWELTQECTKDTSIR